MSEIILLDALLIVCDVRKQSKDMKTYMMARKSFMIDKITQKEKYRYS